MLTSSNHIATSVLKKLSNKTLTSGKPRVENILSTGRVSCGKDSLQPKLQIHSNGDGQVAREARRRSSHVAPTWSGMWGFLGLIFLGAPFLKAYFKAGHQLSCYGLQGPKFYSTWLKIQDPK